MQCKFPPAVYGLDEHLRRLENLVCVRRARLLPEKLTVYTTLVGLLNARNYNFGGEFVEAMIRQLKETLKNNLYDEAVYLVSRYLQALQVLRVWMFSPDTRVAGAFPLRSGQLSCDRCSLDGGHV